MKKIDKYIITSFIGPFLLTFFIALFIMVMQFLWKYIDDMLGKGLEARLVLELIFYASASFVPLALPLAVLIASIMTFGALGEHYELVAIKSSGISLLRFMQPLVIVVCIISLGTFYFSNNILPLANLKFGVLLHDIQHQKPTMNIQPGYFYTDIQGFSIRVGEKESDNKTIKNIMIYDFSSGRGTENVIIAQKGIMESIYNGRFMKLTLFDGTQYQEVKQTESPTKYEYNRTYFEIWEKIFDLSDFSLSRTDESIWKNHYRMMNLVQLQNAIDTFYIEMDERKQYLSNNLASFFSFKKFNTDSLFQTALVLADKNEIVYTDSILKTLNNSKQPYSIISQALNNARNTKSFVGVFMRDLAYRKKILAKHKIEWHRKFTLSVACLALFFIGAPMGALIRKGGFGMPIFIAILFFVLYHVISMSGERIAEEGVISPFMGMWLTIFILSPIGFFLTFKAMNDSPIFNFDWYLKKINQFFKTNYA